MVKAITNIPFGALFSKELQVDRDGYDDADSDELLGYYQIIAAFDEINLDANLLAKHLLDTKKNTEIAQIGKYGNYITLNWKDKALETTAKIDFTTVL